jgi:hypothetical protein
MNDISEQEYLKQELHNMLRCRYGKLTVAQTVGVLEMVKWELINDIPPPSDEIQKLKEAK